MIRKTIISPNLQKDPDLSVTKAAIGVLLSCGITVYAESAFRDVFLDSAQYYSSDFLPEDAEMLLVLGGDGSVLRQAQTALELNIPMLGVNLGRLGFLNDLEMDHLEKLRRLSTGDYCEKERMTLDVSILKNGISESLGFFPLNDVVLAGGGHLADMQLEPCDGCALDYRADGMIVSTPSGSTAYTLSAGGPVIDDRIDALCVTPICPRSFFARSILFPPDDVLRIRNCSDRGVCLSVIADGRSCGELAKNDIVEIRRAQKNLRMIVFDSTPTMRVLQRKMNMQNF